MITENLSTLKINKMTQEQYDREYAADNLSASELYLTPMADHVVDEGSSGNWYYRKWASGVAECWTIGGATQTGTLSASIMGGYCYWFNLTLPFEFSTSQNIEAWANGRTGTGIGFGLAVPTSTSTIQVFITGNQQTTTLNNVYVHVKGKWK